VQRGLWRDKKITVRARIGTKLILDGGRDGQIQGLLDTPDKNARCDDGGDAAGSTRQKIGNAAEKEGHCG
jgi:hypothetical protein